MANGIINELKMQVMQEIRARVSNDNIAEALEPNQDIPNVVVGQATQNTDIVEEQLLINVDNLQYNDLKNKLQNIKALIVLKDLYQRRVLRPSYLTLQQV